MTGTVRTITMKTLAAGPAGTFEEGRTYRVGVQVPAELAEQFLDGGYAVSGDDETQAPAAAAESVTDLGAMNVAQLKAYAAEKGIDLGGASRKIEYLDVIVTELTRRQAEAKETALQDMSVEELRAHADELDIALPEDGDAGDLVAVIEAELQARE